MKTLKFKLKKLDKNQYKSFLDFSHYSNNLYNYGLYIAKKYFKETGKYIGRFKLEKEVKENENYKLLPSQSAQQIIKLIDKNFRSFFVLLKRKNKGEYQDKINTPKFKKRGSCFNIIYTFQNCRLKNSILTFNTSNEYKKQNSVKLKIPFTYNIDGKIKQIIIKPINNGQYFNCYIQYEEYPMEINYELKKENYLAIDLGLDNLATCVSTVGHSFILNGKPLKSYNCWYNKRKAKLKSELKLKNKKDWSKQFTKIEQNRFWFIDNYFNQCVSNIIKFCIENKVANIICGYNKTWKKEINIGKKNNQNFVNIPYLNFKRKLEAKCIEYRIQFVQQEESYTSKCSFLDKEEVCKHDQYLGKRVKRGLFKSSGGRLLNADVNGSANIMKKVIGDVIYKDNQSIVGLMFNPIKINVF
jgi:IS605 OrfB family transposase